MSNDQLFPAKVTQEKPGRLFLLFQLHLNLSLLDTISTEKYINHVLMEVFRFFLPFST